MLTALRLLFITTIIMGMLFVSYQTIQEPTPYINNNGHLAEFPETPKNYGAMQPFFKGIDAWAIDRMHYRQQFITWLNTAKDALGFHQIGQVIVGKEGWVFFDGDPDRENEDARGSTQFTPEELDRWKKYLLHLNNETKKHGAKFIFLMIPNKSTIYPEYLPDNFTRLSDNTRMQQIADTMRDTGVSVIDARHALFEGKKAGQIYLKNDTHWNMLGANYVQYLVMTELAKTTPDINPQLFPFHLANDEERSELNHPADLNYMMGIRNNAYEPHVPVVEGVGNCVGHNNPKSLRPWPQAVGECSIKSTRETDPDWYHYLDTKWPYHKKDSPEKEFLFRGTVNPTGHGTLVMVNDSYFEMLQPYFSNYFQRAYYYSLGRPQTTEIWEGVLTVIHPTVVIEETLERNLKKNIPISGDDYPVE